MDSPNRYGEANIRPAKGKLYEEGVDWSQDPRSEAFLESHESPQSKNTITDDELKERILALLKLRNSGGVERVCAEVSSGVVTLSGEVATREQKIALERAIETIGYIRDILNQVQIKSAE